MDPTLLWIGGGVAALWLLASLRPSGSSSPAAPTLSTTAYAITRPPSTAPRMITRITPQALQNYGVTAPPPSPVQPPPATPTDAMAAEVLRLTNAARAAGGSCTDSGYHAPSAALRWNDRLAAAAQAHAVWMAQNQMLSHMEPGNDPGTRIQAAGYNWVQVSENIAAGQQTPSEVVAAWMASTHGHCTNLLDAGVTDLGIGVARDAGGRLWWVQDFGRSA